jgi:hypothetical protein
MQVKQEQVLLQLLKDTRGRSAPAMIRNCRAVDSMDRYSRCLPKKCEIHRARTLNVGASGTVGYLTLTREAAIIRIRKPPLAEQGQGVPRSGG